MLLGEANAPRYGMLAAIIAGLSSSGNPHTTKFIIMDNSLGGTPWSETLLTTCGLLPEELFLLGTKNANLLAACLQEASQELSKRQQLSGEELVNEPSIFLVMTELDMLEELRRKDGPYGGALKPSLGEEVFLRLITEGPEKGIHLILSFTSLRKMNIVLETRHLEHFHYRVGLKMPVNDFLKFGFVQSRNVGALQKAAAEPVCALYINMEGSEDVLFKPYSLSSGAEEKEHSITQDIDAIARLLAKRSTHK
jgi:DNA segregation ATPase FtsK/SpoIIIE, S-DNA-T family